MLGGKIVTISKTNLWAMGVSVVNVPNVREPTSLLWRTKTTCVWWMLGKLFMDTVCHFVVPAMAHPYSLNRNKHVYNQDLISWIIVAILQGHIRQEDQASVIVRQIYWNHVRGCQGKYLWFRIQFLSKYASPSSSAHHCISKCQQRKGDHLFFQYQIMDKQKSVNSFR